MPNRGTEFVEYDLICGDSTIPLNPYLGKDISFHFSGHIFCISCGNSTKKSFNQGYCYPCFMRLAACDMCIMKPEMCSFAQGGCREPEWGEKNCMIPHTVYLANTSGVKVGITRAHQQETRWRDQGAVQAIPLGQVKTRLESGLVEVALKAHFADRTQWQRMLKNETEPLDMESLRQETLKLWPSEIPYAKAASPAPRAFHYPVLEYPQKVRSLNPEKSPEITGTLLGIKGQYLILDTGVINIRKFGGYECTVSLSA